MLKQCEICNIEIQLKPHAHRTRFCKECRNTRDYNREKEWRQSHPEESNASSAKYRAAHLEHLKAKAREWNYANRELKKIYCHNRRALRKQNGGTLTLQEWEIIKSEQQNKCWDCKEQKELTIGHAIPICKGGRTEYINCLAQCMPCNLKQGQKIHPTFKTYGSSPIVMRLAKLYGEDNQKEEYWDNITELVKKQYAKGIW